MFEFIDYEKVGILKVPLLVGTRNNGVWKFMGVLTESDKVAVDLFDKLTLHFEHHRDQFETQALMMVQRDVVEGACVVSLKTLIVLEGDTEVKFAEDLPLLPLCCFKGGADEHTHNYFTGELAFHQNYPQFTETCQPIIELVKSIYEVGG